MAASGSRTLKLSILADVDQLKKSLAQADNDVKDSSSRIGDFSKKVGLAFAAAGAAVAVYAGKFLVESTKNAIADEAAQRRLALTLQNVAGATSNQIKNLENQISKTSLLYGVTDDQLRPAYERLVRSTNDISKAQDILSIAMDVAAATGKPLETVTTALAKAYDGNASSLGRLGLGIDSSVLKSKDFDAITTSLRDNFKGFAEQEANTFEAKLRRLQIAFDEGKETIGVYVLNAITPMVSLIVTKVVPAIQNLADEVGPKLTPVFKALGDYFNNVLVPAFNAFYNFIKDYIVPILEATLIPIIKALSQAWQTIAEAIIKNKDELEPLRVAFFAFAGFIRDVVAPIIGTFVSTTIKAIAEVIAGLIGLVADITDAIATGFVKIKNFFTSVKNFIADGASTFFTPLLNGMKAVLNAIISLWNKLDFKIDISIPDWVPGVGGKGFKVADIFPDIPMLAKGGIVTSPTLAMIGEAGAEAVIPLNKAGSMGNTFNITVNGAIDAEGTARTIVNVLNNSYYRGTGGATALVTS